jgi:cysteinyl-tRNA synthetase
MAEQELGVPMTIHGGGSDLVFPHHENEIAQTESARGKPLARVWMHNGMVEIDTEKMSKSEGNIFQLSEALDRYGRDAVVAYLISGHYRQPLAFSDAALRQAAAGVERLRNFLRTNPPQGGSGEEDSFVAERREAFLEALGDDFKTPAALREAFDLVAEANRRPLAGAPEALLGMLDLVGLGNLAEGEGVADPEAERLLEEREQARGEGDFERADRIRDELAAAGWEVRDSAEGPQLVRRG